MILHHDDDGSLIDGQVDVTEPIALPAECIEEAVWPPDVSPVLLQEMTQSAHYLARRIGEARQGRRGRDGAVVKIGRVSHISILVIAGGESPAGLAKPKVVAGIRHAVRAIDRHMALVQFPVVGITIFQAMRIESTKRIMGEE